MSDEISTHSQIKPEKLRHLFTRLRGHPGADPNAAIIIPINVQTELFSVKDLLGDLTRYHGSYTIEVVLVFYNYPLENPPEEIELYKSLGARVITLPTHRTSQQEINYARFLGVRETRARITLHFGARVRIPAPNSLIYWYIRALSSGYQLAYSQVVFFNETGDLAGRLWLAALRRLRWVKRNLLGIPTTGGNNYAIFRSLFIQLYETGWLSKDIPVGLASKLAGANSWYSNRLTLQVLAPSPLKTRKWYQVPSYFPHRVWFNLKGISAISWPLGKINRRMFDDEAEVLDKSASPIVK